jgi:predicted ATPase
MLTLVEALGYRCLRDVRRPLGPFQILVGPNASGKTTFLDVISFLSDVVSSGPESAVRARTENFADLTWWRAGSNVELAIELRIPEVARSKVAEARFDTIRYEVRVGIAPESAEIGLLAEKVLLKRSEQPDRRQIDLFPHADTPRTTTITPGKDRSTRLLIHKVAGGNDNFYSETYKDRGKGWVPTFKLGPRKSALGNLPEDESKFPVATWLKQILADGVQQLMLNSLLLRKASPPGQRRGFKPDGSNLPWVVRDLEVHHPDRLTAWISHVKTALPDISRVRTVERADDKHRYVVIEYSGGLEVPSWMASDGTLRLLALTLLAYLPEFTGIYLIEEPENGIHPRAVETMYQSLSSVYDAQLLMATHSPVILSIANPDHVLCFAKTPAGVTDIVRGADHPGLRAWRGETNLGVLFAAGVLG